MRIKRILILLLLLLLNLNYVFGQENFAPRIIKKLSFDNQYVRWQVDSTIEVTYKNQKKYQEVYSNGSGNLINKRLTYFYNSTGDLKELIIEKYDSNTNSYYLNLKNEYEINLKDRFYNCTVYLYDIPTNRWDIVQKIHYEYDEFYNISLRLQEYLVGNVWELSVKDEYKTIYTNESSGLLDSSYLIQSYYSSSFVGGNIGTSYNDKIEIDYDNKLISNIKLFNRIENNWVLKNTSQFVYKGFKSKNPNQIKIKRPIDNYQTYTTYDSLKWKMKIDYKNSLSNSLDEYIEYITINGVKKPNSKKTSIYPDSLGSIIQTKYTYNTQTNSWDYFSRYYKIYNSKKKLVANYTSLFNKDQNQFLPFSGRTYEFKYDSLGNLIDSTVKIVYLNTSYLQNYSKTQYFFYEALGENQIKNTLEAKLYPNPSSNGSVNINLKLEKASNLEIEIADVNGRIISTENLFREKGLNTIKLEGLSKGMFVVSVMTENGVFRTKLLVTSAF